MLQSLRDSTSGIVAWFIVGLLIIPFAFFGIDQFVSGSPDPKLATVGDEEITLGQFRDAHSQRYQRLVQMLGDQFDPSLIDQQVFRSAVLDDLIEQAAQQQYAERGGWSVSRTELLGFLQSVPAFQEEGRFSPERYRSLLQRQGLSPQRYEAQLRDALRVEQLRSVVVDSAFVTPADLEAHRAVTEQQRDIAWVRIPSARFLGDITVSDEAIAEYYAENGSRFRQPERVKLASITLDADALAEAQEPPADDVLRVLYEAEADTRFRSEERRHIRHILITGDGARQSIERAAERIRAGEDFAAVATELSEDPGSAEAGGDLGWVQRGDMVPAFEEAAFALEEGVLSEPVETEFGWHLLRVDRIDASTTKPFDDPEVREELIAIYRQREARTAYREALDTLERLAFEQPGSLEPASEAIGVAIETSDWLERGSGEGLLATPEVAEVAFSEALQAGENSTPISLSPSRVVVVRQADYEPARQLELEEVRERIAGILRRQRAAEAARALAEEIESTVAEGEDLATLASGKGLELEAPGPVARDSGEAETALLRAAFALPRPESDGAPVARMVPLSEGDFAVVVLNAVLAPESLEVAEIDAEAPLVQRAKGRLAGAEFAAYREHITASVKVRRHEAAEDLSDADAAPR